MDDKTDPLERLKHVAGLLKKMESAKKEDSKDDLEISEKVELKKEDNKDDLEIDAKIELEEDRRDTDLGVSEDAGHKELDTKSDVTSASGNVSDKVNTDQVVKSLLSSPDEEDYGRQRKSYAFDEFIDERILVSKNLSGDKEMKIKVLEVSDENPPLRWKFGNRVKINKILITIKHLGTQEIEEGECDIQAVEAELVEKRHYTSTNRWVPTSDIKNGYVVATRHITLISDAIALDYIVF